MSTTWPTYEHMHAGLSRIVALHNALSGDVVGPSGMSWQDVARELSLEMSAYAGRLDALASGQGAGCVCFPSLSEIIED